MWKFQQEEFFHLSLSEVFVNRMIKLGALIDFLSALNSDFFIYETYQHQLKILRLSQLRRQKSQSFLNCCGESCYSLVAVETRHIWDQAGQVAGEVQICGKFSDRSKRHTSLIFQEITWAFLIGQMHLWNNINA